MTGPEIESVTALHVLIERLGEALDREPGEGSDYEGARAAYRAWQAQRSDIR